MTDYKLIPLTVDCIIESENKILMIRRKSDTFNDHLAFPGGFVDYGEPVEHAVAREAKEEVNTDVTPLEILGVYSDPKRDPRGHVISVAFICDYTGKPRAGDDASSYEWIDIEHMKDEKLAFDHEKIFRDYLNWKEKKGSYWSNKS